MKVKRIILMLLLGFLASSLPAREVLKLNLEGAKKQAIQYNKTLKNAGYAIDKSEFQIKEAISSGLPQVSSTLDYSNALGRNSRSVLQKTPLPLRFGSNQPAISTFK